ncbi:hypothetical protein [Stenotrophomonas sp. NPDC078853]|uniref:hypothetical protein n=1 Tax=Stenotrophomonas sp. NPDC078853 TaxID=3364534 RepID=UPI00384D62D9
MANMSFTYTVRRRWWLRYYMAAVVIGCWPAGKEPHEARVLAWIRRGLIIRVRRRFVGPVA